MELHLNIVGLVQRMAWVLPIFLGCGPVTGDDDSTDTTETSGSGATESGESGSPPKDLGDPTTSETDSGPAPDLPGDECPHFELIATTDADLAVFEGVECFTGFVQIHVSTVGDLSPMSALREGGSLSFLQDEDTLLLSDLSGLEALESVEGLDLSADFDSLEGLDSLWHAGSLSFGGGDGGVKSLAGLEALEVVDVALALGSADGEPTPGPANVTSLAPLQSLHTCERLDIVSLHDLESLTGLESLTTVHRLGIRNNTKLADMTALDGVTTLEGWIGIMQNSALPTCQALDFAAKFPELHPQQLDIYENLPDACGG